MDKNPSRHLHFFNISETIQQALKSARTSSFWYWFRIIAAMIFFGGFFVKSFVDDRIRKRDVKKILAYYKHAAPGTIHDGDEHHAHYLAWKYQGKKDKLWKRLESRYSIRVREVDEWDEEDDQGNAEEEEEQNLDGDEF